jgi:S1-C subfamily serine protease
MSIRRIGTTIPGRAVRSPCQGSFTHVEQDLPRKLSEQPLHAETVFNHPERHRRVVAALQLNVDELAVDRLAEQIQPQVLRFLHLRQFAVQPPARFAGVRRAGVRHAGSMENELAALSNELAGAVEQAGRAVVAVNARPRFASSGVLWRPGIVVTAEHAIRRRDEIGITLPDGRTTSATLAGRDAGTDLAVLKLAENGAPAATFGSTKR